MKKLIEDIVVFFGALGALLDLILGTIKSVFFQIVIGAIIIILIIKFIDTTWVRWLLLIMFSGGLFYSIYDDVNLHVQKEAMKAVEKREKQKAEIAKGTYKGGLFLNKEGIWNSVKAIFLLCLCVGVLIYYFSK
jgi:hypothetical protein